jgi:hypothetical protein
MPASPRLGTSAAEAPRRRNSRTRQPSDSGWPMMGCVQSRHDPAPTGSGFTFRVCVTESNGRKRSGAGEASSSGLVTYRLRRKLTLNYMAAAKPVVSFAASAPGVEHRRTVGLVADADASGIRRGHPDGSGQSVTGRRARTRGAALRRGQLSLVDHGRARPGRVRKGARGSGIGGVRHLCPRASGLGYFVDCVRENGSRP